MLQIKDLTITHLKDNRVIINKLSLVLNEGDKAAVIGEEGNGKSTLLKLIYDEKLVEAYVEYTGEIIRNGMYIGYLAQELSFDEKAMSVYEFMCELPCFFECSVQELSETAGKLGIKVELLYSDQRMSALSGGEKVKVQLARVILGKPDVLLLDEPSNDLDIATIEWLESFINGCTIPVLYISHDEMLLENTANKIIHLEQIKRKMEARATVTKTSYADYVENRGNALSRQEQLAKKERAEYEKQQEKFRRIQQKVEQQQNTVSRQNPHGGRLLKKSMHRIKAYEARFEKEYENMTRLPETEDAIFVKFGEQGFIPEGKVVIDYRLPRLMVGECILSENVALRIKGPGKVCIIGKNGCGKTTLLKKLAEELLEREDINAAYMPQSYDELLDMEKTPVEFLSVSGDKEEISRIRTYLGSMKYTPDEMGHRIADLSGGQKAKLLFLKMSMAGCNVLILDEPTRNFSPLSNPVIRNMLRGFGGAIISVSHDRRYINEVIDEVYELTVEGLIRY